MSRTIRSTEAITRADSARKVSATCARTASGGVGSWSIDPMGRDVTPSRGPARSPPARGELQASASRAGAATHAADPTLTWARSDARRRTPLAERDLLRPLEGFLLAAAV